MVMRLVDGLYSHKAGRWHAFDAPDTEFAQAAFQRPDEDD
jgi:hypothetical protein